MIKLFITGIYRTFLRNKLSTLLNLASLVIGLTAFTQLSLIVNHELGYDKHHKNYDRIFRVQTRQEDSYPTNYCTYGPSAFRYHLVADLPEIENAVLLKEAAGQYFTLSDGSQLYEKYGYWSENSIFDIFTVRLKEGTSETALIEPNTIALSETLSGKIFPEGEALGRHVLIGKRHPLTVTAVYRDFPENSTLKPSFLVSMPTFDALKVREGYRDNWTYIDWDTYVLLKKGAGPASVDLKIKDAFSHVENLKKSTPYLHPLSKHHTSPSSQPDFLIGISVLSLAAILILVLSCVNYVNLSMATSTIRAKEIGIKKVVGAPKEILTAQFLGETLMLTFIAMIIGLVLSQLSTPVIGQMLNKPIEVHLFSEGRLLVIIAAVSLAAGLISGLYPAKVLSAYNPVKVLKGNFLESNRKTVSLKKVLVVSQFSITLFMLVVSFILQAHVRYILNKDLGFKDQEILFSEVNFNDTVSFESVRERLIQHPEIKDAACSFSIPFHSNNGGFVSWDGAGQDEKVMVSRNYVSRDFINTYGIQIVKGRDFSPDFSADEKKCIINETALKTFGWNNIEGKQLHLNGKSYPVIGVVKDFHAYSVHNPIPVYIFFLRPDKVSGSVMVTVRHTPGTGRQAKENIQAELGEVLPNDPFEFKDFDTLFFQDAAIPFWQSLKRIFFFFSVVTILVSVMGLLGLMIFTIQRRTKEIGIRKVLGSSIFDLYQKLSSEVLWLLIVSMVFAFPMAVMIYKVMPGAYKEPLSAFDFLLSFGIVAAGAVLAISYHVLKISVSNPVEALKYE